LYFSDLLYKTVTIFFGLVTYLKNGKNLIGSKIFPGSNKIEFGIIYLQITVEL